MFEVGNPVFSSRHVLPPSILLWIPLSGPPPIYAATVLWRCQVAAYKTSGSLGSITISVTPVHSSSPRILFHDSPPSVVLYNPLSPPLFQSGPCADTHTISELSGWTIIVEICSEFSRPIFFQVFPSSMLL